MRDDRRLVSPVCSARYRFENGRIVEVWSTRRNYAFMCGPHLEYRVGFAMELLRVSRWKARTPQLDLTAGVRNPPVSCVSSALAGALLTSAD
jgi:hypothetical protein